MKIYKFGEHKIDMQDKWYINQDGEKIKCGEYEIDKLWFQWVNLMGTNREDDKDYNIFVSKIELKLE